MEEGRKWAVIVLLIVAIGSLLFAVGAQIRVKNCEDKFYQAKEQIAGLEKQVSTIQANKDKLLNENKTCYSKIDKLNNSISKLIDEKKKLIADLNNAKNTINSLKIDIEKLKRLKKTLEEAVMKLPEDKVQEINSNS